MFTSMFKYRHYIPHIGAKTKYGLWCNMLFTACSYLHIEWGREQLNENPPPYKNCFLGRVFPICFVEPALKYLPNAEGHSGYHCGRGLHNHCKCRQILSHEGWIHIFFLTFY